MVYVINQSGKPLMPTTRHGRVRHLLKSGKAKVINREPFTIQLQYQSTNYTQDIILGVDAGSKHIGLSATTETTELYAAEIELRQDITELLANRRMYRRNRRSRKTRYRQPRFDNRTSGKKHWLAPSIRNKIQTHQHAVAAVHSILPIKEIIVEVASFDIQKIKNPAIEGTGYQTGEQMDFWNVREYVLFRDGHTCQCCRGKSKDKILNVHHIESRKTGGDAPNNLITLCETCHKKHHTGDISLPKTIRRGMRFRDATFMGIMRWAFYNQLKELYTKVHLTYGYITKNTRITHGLLKTHCVDARCISGHPDAMPLDNYFFQKKVRCHNRMLHKATIRKGGKRQRNQAGYTVHGFRLFDRVMYKNKQYYIFGRRTSGYFDIRTLAGERVNNGSISYKKLRLLDTKKYLLTERRPQVLNT